MKRRRAARDVQKASDLLRRLSLRRPFEALEFAWRQRNTVDDAIGHKPPPRLGMKIHRHELEDAPVLLDTALEGRAAFVGRECDRCDRPARIVNWNGEPRANAEMSRLVVESALRFR